MRIDPTVRTAGDRLLLGGSPTTLFRLTPAGAAWFTRLRAGRSTDATPAQAALARRWIDAGVLHPLPAAGSGPYDASQVTVVVPVRDRAEGVARLLESLARDGAPIARVLVVDDGSRDAAALARVDDAPRAEVLRRERSGGPAAARNDGADAAFAGAGSGAGSGADTDPAVLVVIDSDCTVEPGWLDPLLAAFADPTVAAVAPRVAAGTDERGVLAAYERVRSPLDLGPLPARVAPGTRVSYVPSAALAVRADRWRELGGFDDALRVGEDVDLVWRAHDAGFGVRYEPTSVVRHEVRAELRAWLAQRVAYGSSAAPLAERHPGRLAPAVLSPWSLAVWALVAIGRPRAGVLLAFATTGQLRRRLDDVPTTVVMRLGLGGHLGAGRQLAEAIVRVGWPLALPAAVISRRARRVVVASALCTVLVAARDARRRGEGTRPDPLRFAALVLADHAAYGAGVWKGMWRARRLSPLLPRLTSNRATRRSRPGDGGRTA
ncbi:MAG: mycofactocin biosynthesis glycosyltransferase MftF [Microthrixaceae bacterium]